MPATYENFAVDVDGALATVTIDRPGKRNAMTVQMWRDLAAICTELAGDRELRATVLTGSGTSFCAGADISALSEDDAVMKSVVGAAEAALRELPAPTIAMISGHCMGGGSQLAIACDLRIADTTATFAVPPAKLGVVYSVASTRNLVELVGPAVAKRLMFTAETIDAAEALRVGLVDEVVEPDHLAAAVRRRIEQLLPLAPLTQFAAKQIVNALADGADADALYAAWHQRWARDPDGAEGPRAFLERRPPVFGWRPN